ncbi:clk-2 [Pristionchus pacificus]|nr:clk-2 [Pristionchus pacificus]
MSLIDRINNAREAGVIVNILADTKRYLEVNRKESIDILSCIARSSLSFSHLLSFTELKFLTDLFRCTENSSIEWKMDVFIALFESLSAINKGTSISPIIDLLSRYIRSNSISSILISSIHSIDEETHSRFLEYVSLLSRLPDTIVTISLGSRPAHECGRRLGASVAIGVKEGLQKAWKRMKDGEEGGNDLRVLSSMITKGRNMRVNEESTLINTTVSFLQSRMKSPLWDEISQALVVRGESSVLEEEHIVAVVIENCNGIDDFKRFFGHWLNRCKSVERACMVKYVVQRSLDKKRTRALVEYIDWTGGMERIKDITLRLIRILSTRMGVSAPEKDSIHRIRVLIECGRRMKERDEMEADSFWKENYPMIMQATRLHLESTDRRIRELGLIVAESVSFWMKSDNPLQFDYYDGGKGLIEELRRRARGEEDEIEINEEMEELSIKEKESKEKKLDSDDEIEEENKEENTNVEEMDSDDTDDEVYEKLQKTRNKNEMISSNYENAKVHSPPSYLREALEWIATEKEKYEKFEAGLGAIEVLFRKKAVGWNEVGISALNTFIHLENRFASQGFENTVLRCMVAIVVGQPSQLAPYLAEAIFDRNIAVKQRYLITTVLVNAAKELAGVDQSAEKTMVNPYKEYDVMKPETSKCSETLPPNWIRVVSERVRSNTRHFSIRPATNSSSGQRNKCENRFARIADRFILPLLKSKVGEHLELTGRDISLLIRILYTACELLTLAENSPSIIRITLSLTSSVESLRYHDDSSVREVVVAAYFAAATVLPEQTLALECKSWLQYCISRMNDEEEGERARKLAGQTTRIILMRLRLDESVELD